MMTNLLPNDPNQAAQRMIDLTTELASLLQNEQRAISKDDAVRFAANESDKTKTVDYFQKAAAEFAEKAQGWQGQIDLELLNQLTNAQMDLRDAASGSNQKIASIPGVKEHL